MLRRMKYGAVILCVLLAASSEGCRLRVVRRRGSPVARLLALTDTEWMLHVAQ